MRALVLLLALYAVTLAQEVDTVLRFRPDGTFQIAQIADLHYGEGEAEGWGPEQDVNSTRVMQRVLSAEKPDLVVFTGDQLTGNNINTNATAYWSELVSVCVQQQLRWSMVFGNHDDAPLQPLRSGQQSPRSVTTRQQLMAFDSSFPLSLSQAGPTSLHGVSNYVLPVYAADARGKLAPGSKSWLQGVTPLALLYFLDSGGGSYAEILYADQVAWYNATSLALAAQFNRTIPALAFVHIPTAQYVDVEGQPSCFGMDDDGITPTDTDTGLLAAFHARGDVRAMFTGHDHGNDWCCAHKNQTVVWLCYGRHTGYGGYGDWDRGSRQIQLKLNSGAGALNVEHSAGADGAAAAAVAPDWSTRTWVRMEDGSVIDGGSLNGGARDGR